MNIISNHKLCVAKYFQHKLHSSVPPSVVVEQVESLLREAPQKQLQFLHSVLPASKIEMWNSEFERQHLNGIHFSIYGDTEYPQSFLRIDYPPLFFSYIGQPIWKSLPGLAVVGSREATHHSLDWMEQHLSGWLQGKAGFIVSGGARGIDQKAHELALRHQVPTVVVIPSGLGQIYPPKLKSWISEILQSGGAIISEYDHDQDVRKHFFQARNRLISGLGICCLVIQAERKSGTMITARRSLEQGRPVFIVPSHPCEVRHLGGLDLMMDGAPPVRDAQDLNLLFDSESLVFWTGIQPLGPGVSSLH